MSAMLRLYERLYLRTVQRAEEATSSCVLVFVGHLETALVLHLLDMAGALGSWLCFWQVAAVTDTPVHASAPAGHGRQAEERLARAHHDLAARPHVGTCACRRLRGTCLLGGRLPLAQLEGVLPWTQAQVVPLDVAVGEGSNGGGGGMHDSGCNYRAETVYWRRCRTRRRGEVTKFVRDANSVLLREAPLRR